jgi:hypothetical protein
MADNYLLELRFDADPRVYRNALIEIDGQTRRPPFTVPLPDHPRAKTFVVVQEYPGQDATVPVVAIDRCGAWTTFVGGGALVFQ